MKIAFFADSYKPYISGVTNSIELLVKGLRALGHKVYIFAPYYPGEKDEDPDIIRLPSLPTGYPGFRLSIPYLLNVPAVDIIHTHSPFQTGLLARYLARRKKVPLVYTFHTLFTRYVHYAGFLPERFSKIAMATYLRQFCRRVDLVIAPSKMSKRVLNKWGVSSRCEIVQSGISVNDKKENGIRKALAIPGTAKVLAYVGRISKEKNLPFLIEAFERLYQEDRYLLLVGGGPMLEELQAKNIPNVIFVGEKSHKEALEYYHAGDVFVFASLTETQGLVLAEAKSAGLPVVALFAGGLVDTVRSGIDGYLTSRNVGSFVAHVERLLNDDVLRKKMGAAASLDARERFSSAHVAKRIETLYNSLIKQGGQNDK